MSALREIRIFVPENVENLLRQKMETGKYATEAELIADGLAAIEDRDDSVEQWLANDVAQAYDRWQVDRRSLSLDEAFEGLEDTISGHADRG
jgi:Arc/MetJ-type ribon-helix-helix transcriptional regulator